ncbi:MAG: flippase-like domain-containing protein [Chloroflexi bacterium]|nr:flippase-like domain-containing protein [Ardenticatenaceae bacterium]NOG33120.1 flippase-like domain-containing protein [Chloroflexota bacterium]
MFFPHFFTAECGLWLLLRQIGFQAIWVLLRQVDGPPYTRGWLLIGFGWYFLTNVCRAYRFGVLLAWPGPTQPLRLLPDMLVLSFLNNVLPARVGELLFPFWLQKRHQLPIGQSLAMLLITRLFDFLAVCSLFLLFALLSRDYLAARSQQIIQIAIIVLGPSLLLLAMLPWLGKQGLAILDWLLKRLGLAGYRWGQRLRQLGEGVVTAVTQIYHGRIYMKSFIWSLLAWLSTFAWFGAFLRALGIPFPYPFTVVGATFAVLANAIPFITVGGFWAHDVGWAFGFSLMGMGWETAVVTGFAVNVLTVIVSVLFSGGVFAIFCLRKTGQ